MNLRQFTDTDVSHLIELFRITVHSVCAKDYSQEQLKAWAPEKIDQERFLNRLKASFTLVALDGNSYAGFASLLGDGCVDMFYVSADFQRHGVGNLLMSALEGEARSRKLSSLYSDVSLTAREFFRRKGFLTEKEYTKAVSGVEFPNAIMRKKLTL